MPSTLSTASAAHTLSLLALLAATASGTHAHAHLHHPPARPDPAAAALKPRASVDLSAMTYQGCYSSSAGLIDQGAYTFQSSGYCQPLCVGIQKAVLALSGGSDCWCGDTLPPQDSKVDEDKCDVGCNGFDKENCGGDGFYSVYLSGTEDEVENYSGSATSGQSTTASSSTTGAPSPTTVDSSSSPSPTTNRGSPDSSDSSDSSESSTTQAPVTVITSAAPGTTVIVTQPATQNIGTSPTAEPTEDSNNGGGGGSSTNVAGVAAGVVVGVLGAAAIVAAIVLWIRHKKRQAAEEEYKRSNQVSDFMAGHGMRGGGGSSGEPKPPPSAYSQMSDQRLDPEAGRRNSAGSIADDQDYSRRILRVANPDSS